MNQEAIRSFYEANGYYHARGVFAPAELRELGEDFDRMVAQMQASQENNNAYWPGEPIAKLGAAGTVVFHTHNVQTYSARWHRAFLQPQFLAITSALLGPDIVLHHSKLFQKPAEHGAPFPMHQDWTYFPTIKDTMLAGIIHISPATEEMGCFRVYPGTHRLGRAPNTNGQQPSAWLDQYPLAGATPLVAEPGDVVFFHYCLVHGSQPNRSPHVRKTVLVQMHAGDDRLEDESAPGNSRLVLQGWNHAAKRSTAWQA